MSSMGVANRDARAFDGAEDMDLTRSPNPHLSFGAGAHSCLGQALARTELQVTLEVLLHPRHARAGRPRPARGRRRRRAAGGRARAGRPRERPRGRERLPGGRDHRHRLSRADPLSCPGPRHPGGPGQLVQRSSTARAAGSSIVVASRWTCPVGEPVVAGSTGTRGGLLALSVGMPKLSR
ncbi:cytochrome P450 [Pseudonocardia sp. S2-4]|uniref:Cytochrome P450 n=1 Tax=Pseudonocardia humida TaxID=2800819 RepID=A0ABT0ZXF4_9PSEU|nr:cytochrome P450 [Pseudonocardia humida]